MSPAAFAPLIHNFHAVFTVGAWLILAAIGYRLLFPYLKGGR
jgi:hypothetical protein